MHRLAFLLIALASLIAPGHTSAGQEVHVVLPRDSVYIGQRFPLIVVAEYGPELDLRVPSADAATASFGDFELLRILDRSVTEALPGTIRDSLVFEATTFELDRASTAGARISFAVDRDTFSVEVGSSVVRVASVLHEGDTPRDLAPIVEIPWVVWPWVVVMLVILASAVYLFRRHRARRTPTGSVAPEIRLTPYEEACRRLDALVVHPTDDAEHRKAFVIELSDTLRTYIAQRLDIPARELTTREIVAALARSGGSPAMLSEAGHVLDVSDRVKFAREEASASSLHEERERARRWIDTMEDELQKEDQSETAINPASTP